MMFRHTFQLAVTLLSAINYLSYFHEERYFARQRYGNLPAYFGDNIRNLPLSILTERPGNGYQIGYANTWMDDDRHRTLGHDRDTGC
jgi:hypothetical protein